MGWWFCTSNLSIILFCFVNLKRGMWWISIAFYGTFKLLMVLKWTLLKANYGVGVKRVRRVLFGYGFVGSVAACDAFFFWYEWVFWTLFWPLFFALAISAVIWIFLIKWCTLVCNKKKEKVNGYISIMVVIAQLKRQLTLYEARDQVLKIAVA